MASNTINLNTWSAKRVIGDNQSQNPAGALLHSGTGRADNSTTGDTWIFLDTLGGTTSYWGFKHSQGDNAIKFYGGGTLRSTIWLGESKISATTFDGNAATATKWQTARTLTIGNTGKSVDGSGNVSWSMNEIMGSSDSSKFYRGDKTWSNSLTGNLTLTNGGIFRIDHTEQGAKTKGTAYSAFYITFKNSTNDKAYAVTPIRYVGTDGTDQYNTCVILGSDNGTTWIGAGESSNYLPGKIAYNDENLYLSADGSIKIYTNGTNDGSSYSGPVTISGTTVTANLAGNATTATTLQTSRTIWGQSFNGSGNVSGNLSGVGGGLYAAANVTLLNFLTSGGGALYGKFGGIGISGNYSDTDTSTYGLDIYNRCARFRTANAALGIATSSPYKIGTDRKTIHIQCGNSSGTGVNDGYASAITFGDGSAYAGIYYQSSGSYGSRLIFGTTDSYANGAYARVIITHIGRVGIGTMTPDSKLHVYSPNSATSTEQTPTVKITGKLDIVDNVTGGGTANSLLNILYNGTHEYGVVVKIHSYGGDSPGIRFSHSSSAAEINSQVNTNWTVGMYYNSTTDFAITRDRGTNGWGTAVLRIDNNNYIYTSSYLNLGGGNENNASSPPRVLGFNGSDNFVRSYQTAYLNVNSANYISTYAANGGNNLACLQSVFDSIPKSVGTAIRLQHGSHSMALGWFLSGYGYANAYGGWLVSNYDDLSFCGVSNGTWRERHVWMAGDSVTNAVWNDLAECRTSCLREPGYAIAPSGARTASRLIPGARITSDTWGFALGDENDETKMPVAISGRVLAYPAYPREKYHLGDCVCSAPDGKVDIMTRQEIRDWPDCIIGIVNEIPDYDEWGPEENDHADRNKIKVNGRIWIDIK